MKRPGFLVILAAILAVAVASPARAADALAETVILVAKPQLRDQLYGSTIIIARPVGNDRHVGFIINKPTQVTLGKLFPNHAPSQKVPGPVYLGGPYRTEVIFALVQRPNTPGGHSVQITRDLYLAMETEVVDRIIEVEPQHARFFAGMVLWKPGELSSELNRGLWYVLDAQSDLVVRKSTDGLWEELVRRSERQANMI
jgi:putative transcriptional regulator